MADDPTVTDAPQQGEAEGPAPDDQSAEQPAGDTTQGYHVDFYAFGDGSYGVGTPEPLSGDEADVEHVPDLTTAMKHLLLEVKQNPIGASDQENFDAGFGGQSTPNANSATRSPGAPSSY